MTIFTQSALIRHKQYENRFAKSFYKVLTDIDRQIAKNLLEGLQIENIKTDAMNKVYDKLYQDIMRKEGMFVYNSLVLPAKGIEKKDIFDEVATVLAPDNLEALLPFLAGLMNGFLTFYIGRRIIEVVNTSIRRANEKILKLRELSMTNEQIAKDIRMDAKTRQLRANTIARTEATTALNKSWMLTLASSGEEWEKSWNAMRDDRTRDSHWETDPQLWIDLKDNFVIGGFIMAFPGDSSQGAPIGQFINCRCLLSFRIKGDRFGWRPKR